jgi:hypothetical protein
VSYDDIDGGGEGQKKVKTPFEKVPFFAYMGKNAFFCVLFCPS